MGSNLDHGSVVANGNPSLAIILFTKAPKPGFVKTRFISQAGPLSKEECSSLYVCLLKDTLAAVVDLQRRRNVSLIVAFTPKDEEDAIKRIVRQYVGDAHYIPQKGINVTQKVRNALECVFNQGYEAVSLIPGDHPDLDGSLLSQSFDCLRISDGDPLPRVTLGPTCDGGAYLLGFNKNAFSQVQFNLEDTFKVCADILRNARAKGIPYTILENRTDLDDWGDVRHFLRSAKYQHTNTHSFLRHLKIPVNNDNICKVSVIIPTLNEERVIGDALACLEAQTEKDFEIILVDAVSSDSTIERSWARVNKIVFVNKPSRKKQENIGAIGSRGAVLLFLHADLKLSLTVMDEITTFLKDPSIKGGNCHVTFDGNGFKYRFLDAFRACGSRLLRVHGISSAFFVRRSDFLEVGGFREDAMEEAVDLVQRLSDHGRFITLKQTVILSARRFERGNFLLVTALWITTVLLTLLGFHETSIEEKLWRAAG